jgi:uncharacterized phage protein gp47/JayE
MAYVAPYIDATGFHIPTYADIRDQLISDAQAIFGNDVYLETDSADYQLIAVCSLKMHDALEAAVLAYNNRGPQTAVGSGLDGIVLLNGISRLVATYSTCQQTITGTYGTVITNGRVRDALGNLWDLSTSVTIPVAGYLDVSIVCQVLGPIEAEIGTIAIIDTPTSGWISTTNAVQAVPGRAQESDAELRARQALSVALPSQTLLEGTEASILSVANVTRAVTYENDTNTTSSPDGFPPHSITAVVEGGTDLAVAEQIFYNKGIGGYTNGTTLVVITDLYGQPSKVRFYRPTYVPIFVTVTLSELTGWSPSMTALIKAAVADYLNSLKIGDDVIISSLWGEALTVMPDLKNPAFSIGSIVAGKLVGSQAATNIVLLFNEAAQGVIADVTVTVV